LLLHTHMNYASLPAKVAGNGQIPINRINPGAGRALKAPLRTGCPLRVIVQTASSAAPRGIG
ncbi:MAG: hypothetical protein J6T92_04360, partial [Ottowia sp.]|nr:hypothetical protein [Ottowia sp.]